MSAMGAEHSFLRISGGMGRPASLLGCFAPVADIAAVAENGRSERRTTAAGFRPQADVLDGSFQSQGFDEKT